ncbi:YjcQ family protein [Clostridium sp. CF012]|uniref:YjcQ family protein n=1 Tax=Clostridium sp. CF012 TaxID=2843319 RepID=UPI001C0C08AB|nr:YjcQ family protein [Clostridium sp. CF012]MBU3142249.1 YjcQ family protein [Clostridium sp. CF012]
MDNFKTIYKILKKLEDAMDEESFDFDTINHESMGISEMRLSRIIKMMVDNGLIDGVEFFQCIGQSFPEFKPCDPHITLEGLHYLEENSAMTKIAKALKGVKEIIPMM